MTKSFKNRRKRKNKRKSRKSRRNQSLSWRMIHHLWLVYLGRRKMSLVRVERRVVELVRSGRGRDRRVRRGSVCVGELYNR